MKKALFVLVGLVVSFLVWQKLTDTSSSKKKDIVSPQNSKENTVESSENLATQESIFVPYWGVTGELVNNEYDEEYYFGITFDEKGNLTQDDGLTRIQGYKIISNSKDSYLVVRLINNETNRAILGDRDIQKKVISSGISQVNENSFDGILLDLEMSGLGFESTEKSITHFIQEFSKEVKKQNKGFYVALYGDTFYRARPYNVKEIAKVADKIVVMSYDFHKARGTHGPNFPFEKGRKYPYDFKMMIEDFKKEAASEKIEIVFGMFGYDWGTNDQEIATSYSYNKIKQDFLGICDKERCTVEIDKTSKEGHVTYKQNNINHDVWFESPDSVAVKIRYAKSQGIRHFSYWAYSYF